MADILELAFWRVTQNGMSQHQAAEMLEHFARGDGRDIGWNDIAPWLSRATMERIDRAAVGWMLNPDNDKPAPVQPVREVRDGKMLATGGE